MRCSNKQYNDIKSKLKNFRVTDCDFNFKRYPYLTNNYGNPNSKDLGTHSADMIRRGTEIHETWNEKIFLEACGIEVEEIFVITKTKLREYSEERQHCLTTQHVLRDIFPFAFFEEKKELVVEAGRWYKKLWKDGDIDIFYAHEVNNGKVNVGKVDGKNMYFMEIDGRIDEISGMYFMSIKKVD